MKIQLDIPSELNKELKIIKAQNDFKSLKETILAILESQVKKEDEQDGSEPRS